jgi:hypothetical protein
MPKRRTMKTVAFMAAGTTTAMLIALATVTAGSRPALANAAIAKKTGQPCTKCHTAAPALNSYGQKYKGSQKK